MLSQAGYRGVVRKVLKHNLRVETRTRQCAAVAEDDQSGYRAVVLLKYMF